MNETIITSRLVSISQRSFFLPKHFGSLMLVAESGIYNATRSMCPTYSGGYWNFYELSNDGFYMAPEGEELLPYFVMGNGYEGLVSTDAAGIISTLVVLNALCWETKSEKAIKQYYLLRDYVAFHSEASEIYAAID